MNLLSSISKHHKDSPIRSIFEILFENDPPSQEFFGLSLKNPNTLCYMNSTINALMACDSIRQFICSEQAIHSNGAENVIHLLRNIAKGLCNDASQLRIAFGNACSDFQNTDQQDASEFLLQLLQLAPQMCSHFETHITQNKEKYQFKKKKYFFSFILHNGQYLYIRHKSNETRQA